MKMRQRRDGLVVGSMAMLQMLPHVMLSAPPRPLLLLLMMY
jgi:hypothetical protein